MDLLKKSNNPSLICGNGLSVNFEPALSLDHLGKTMYSTHTYILTHSSYKVLAPKMKQVFSTNYTATIKHLKKTIKSEDNFIQLFSDAIIFAKKINSPHITEWIRSKDFSPHLTMGFSPLDYVSELIKQSDQGNSVFSVNYELWTVLIYFALVIQDAPIAILTHLGENKFVQAVRIGGQHSLELTSQKSTDYYLKTVENGMFIYYRLLLSTNILLTGNGYNVKQMSKWGSYQKDKLNDFFILFKCIMTTNYDLLLENLTNQSIRHLHGCYMRSPQIVLGQSLSVFIDAIRYDLSSILIGDYFISKTFFAITAHMSGNRPDFYNEIMEQVISDNKSDTIVIFGLNINNDFHIIRNLQVLLERSGLKQCKIIYCYFNTEDKISFERAYESCITYSDELNKYVRDNISTYTLDSHYILQHFFIVNREGNGNSNS